MGSNRCCISSKSLWNHQEYATERFNRQRRCKLYQKRLSENCRSKKDLQMQRAAFLQWIICLCTTFVASIYEELKVRVQNTVDRYLSSVNLAYLRAIAHLSYSWQCRPIVAIWYIYIYIKALLKWCHNASISQWRNGKWIKLLFCRPTFNEFHLSIFALIGFYSA